MQLRPWGPGNSIFSCDCWDDQNYIYLKDLEQWLAHRKQSMSISYYQHYHHLWFLILPILLPRSSKSHNSVLQISIRSVPLSISLPLPQISCLIYLTRQEHSSSSEHYHIPKNSPLKVKLSKAHKFLYTVSPVHFPSLIHYSLHTTNSWKIMASNKPSYLMQSGPVFTQLTRKAD